MLIRAAARSFVCLMFCLVACAPSRPLPLRDGGIAQPADGYADGVLRTSDGLVPLHLQLACSDEEHARGLMHRRAMGPWDGMLFVFADAAPRTFWMHNTPMTLDMLFFDAHGSLVCVIADAEPMTDDPRSCAAAVRYVIELPAGSVRRRHLGAPATLQVPALPGRCGAGPAP